MLQSRAAARNLTIKKASLFNTLVDEMVEVLHEMGGSAHRESVIERVAVRQGADRASDRLRRDLMEAFDLHRTGADGCGKRIRLRLPFGEGSHRWALTLDAAQFGYDRPGRDMGMASEARFVTASSMN
jgi:hypothetical protein